MYKVRFVPKSAQHLSWTTRAPDGKTSGEQLLDVKQTARMFRMKPSTIYQWAYQRRLPVVKLGRSLRFRLSDVENLIFQSVRAALNNQNDRVQ